MIKIGGRNSSKKLAIFDECYQKLIKGEEFGMVIRDPDEFIKYFRDRDSLKEYNKTILVHQKGDTWTFSLGKVFDIEDDIFQDNLKAKNPRTLESWMMVNGKKGDYFYSDKIEANVTATAHYYGRKIITKRFVLVNTGITPFAKHIIKVTLQ